MPQIVVNKEFEALIKDMDKQKDKSIKCGTQHSQTVGGKQGEPAIENQ